MIQRIRLISGLILTAFLFCHMLNHAFGIISAQAMQDAFRVLMLPWVNPVGKAVLLAAMLAHMVTAVYAIAQRRGLVLKRGEWWQLGLGFSIPVLLYQHILGAEVVEQMFGLNVDYTFILVALWVWLPVNSIVQSVALLVAWGHACLGVYYWSRLKPWFPKWQPTLWCVAVALPVASLAGFVSGGMEMAAEAELNSIAAGEQINEDAIAFMTAALTPGLVVAFMIPALPFVIYGVRTVRERWLTGPRLELPDGRSFTIRPGATVLETLKENKVPHASVCGGRGRCSTCRVRVGAGGDQLPIPEGIEADALKRIGAPDGMRLACQIRPTKNLHVAPLLPAHATAADGRRPGGLEGEERWVTSMFIDLRGSTKLGESRMPYDVLFVLNQFFSEMTAALHLTGGHYAQFTGDGLMALYGLDSQNDPSKGARAALAGAAEMLARLDKLNRQLQADLDQPLKMGIGVHHGVAIVGSMGPPQREIITAIGDTINTAARLEAKTKEHGVPLVLSEATAAAAGLNLDPADLMESEVRGRKQSARYFALSHVPDVGAGRVSA